MGALIKPGIQSLVIKRGSESNRTSYIPDVGEPITITDTDDAYKKLFIGDGTTAGGIDVYDVITSQLDDIFLTVDEIDNQVATKTNGKVDVELLPDLVITDVTSYSNESDMLASSSQKGDIAIRTDIHKSYINNGGTSGTMADWTVMNDTTASITSINGQVGDVWLGADPDISEGIINKYSSDEKIEERFIYRLGQSTLQQFRNFENISPTDGQILVTNSNGLFEPIDELKRFIDAEDTPDSYVGQAGKWLVSQDSSQTPRYTFMAEETVFDCGTF